MSTTEKAGTLLPQNSPDLELFIKTQAHIRKAIDFIDDASVIQLPQLTQDQADTFKNLCEEIRSMLWENYGNVQDLMSAFYLPLFPIEPIKE